MLYNVKIILTPVGGGEDRIADRMVETHQKVSLIKIMEKFIHWAP